jgi:hypothetical protein
VDARNSIGLSDAFDSLFLDLSFSEGLAPFLDGERFGYIGKTGEIAIPARFETESAWFPRFQNGWAALYRAPGQYALIDRTGAERVPFGDHYITQYGDMTEVVARGGGAAQFLDADGNAALAYASADERVSYLGGGMFLRGDERTRITDESGREYVVGASLYRLADGAVFPLDGVRDFQFWRLDEDRFLGLCVQSVKLFDGEGNVIYDFGEGYSVDMPATELPGGRLAVGVRGGWPLKRGVADLDGGWLVRPVYEALVPAGDMYAARSGRYGGLLGKDGEWVVKLSLLDSLTD